MADQLTEEQITRIKECFSKQDTNGDGSISMEELEAALTSVGLDFNDPKIQDKIKQIDVDGNGRISFSEFLDKAAQKIAAREGGN